MNRRTSLQTERQNAEPTSLRIETADGELAAEFYWQNDRFTHKILRNDSSVSVAISIDGTDDEDWPPSPPLQQLSLEHINSQTVLLGVGAAGRSHWSISVEPIDVDRKSALRFELACRHSAAPSFLGSSYQAGNLFEFLAGPQSKLLRQSEGDLVIQPSRTTDAGTQMWSYVIKLA